MSVFNRRNAAFGWMAWTVSKRVLKKKAKGAVPAIDTESKKPNKGAIALLVAGTVGALTFWKKRSGGDDAPSSAPTSSAPTSSAPSGDDAPSA